MSAAAAVIILRPRPQRNSTVTIVPEIDLLDVENAFPDFDVELYEADDIASAIESLENTLGETEE